MSQGEGREEQLVTPALTGWEPQYAAWASQKDKVTPARARRYSGQTLAVGDSGKASAGHSAEGVWAQGPQEGSSTPAPEDLGRGAF